MKVYKSAPEKVADTVNEPVVVYEVTQPLQAPKVMQEFKIPRDENGKPIGTPWEVILERMYDNLSEHYGVDLRTL